MSKLDATVPGWNRAPGLIGYRWPAFGLMAHVRADRSETFVVGAGINGSNFLFIDGVRALWGSAEIGFLWWTARLEVGLFLGRRDPMYTEILHQIARSDADIRAQYEAAAKSGLQRGDPPDLTESDEDDTMDDGVFTGGEDEDESV